MKSGSSMPITSLRETAGTHMLTEIPRATIDSLASEVIEDLRGRKYECADTVFITDTGGRLRGIVRINDLLAAGDRPIAEIMQPEHEGVGREDDQEQIAVLAMQLNMIAVPVVDSDMKLVGAVPPEALFKILRDEHMEDLQRLAGIAPHAEGPDFALDAPLHDRVRRRLPWLVVGLLASSAVTFVMAGFEHTLSENVAVAFFVPALVYIAGAIGTQAVSVAVRGLAGGSVAIGRLLRDELMIGLAIGGFLGLISSILVYVGFSDTALALAVGLAVLAGGAVSASVGFALPWIFQRSGSDPALGSGPICTILQDVASLTIYFLLVSVLIL